MTERHPSEFRDPAKTISEIAQLEPLRPGDVRIAVVHDPSSTQQLVDVIDLPAAEWRELDAWRLPRYLEDKVDELEIPERSRGGPRHATLTIVARRGFAVIGPDEGLWVRAWFFCNHSKLLYTSGLVVVTEHGWTDFMTARGGLQPALQPALQPVSVRPEREPPVLHGSRRRRARRRR